VAEPKEFAVDAPVAPGGVLACKANDQASEFGVDWASASGRCWRLGPMPSHKSSVPAQDGFWFDDQKRVASTCPTPRKPDKGEDGSIGVGQPRPSDLTLENQHLVSQREDLGASGVTGGEYPPEPGENEAHRSRQEGHERGTQPASPMPGTPEPRNHMADQYSAATASSIAVYAL
jgi:hypothetical protein